MVDTSIAQRRREAGELKRTGPEDIRGRRVAKLWARIQPMLSITQPWYGSHNEDPVWYPKMVLMSANPSLCTLKWPEKTAAPNEK